MAKFYVKNDDFELNFLVFLIKICGHLLIDILYLSMKINVDINSLLSIINNTAKLPCNGMNLRYNLRLMPFYFYPFFVIVSRISFNVV